MQSDKITFSFGKNWKNFLATVSKRTIQSAIDDLEDWLGKGTCFGKTVLDIGSGSGIQSLAFHLLGAKLEAISKKN